LSDRTSAGYRNALDNFGPRYLEALDYLHVRGGVSRFETQS
jgi:hypothetical protein